MILVLDFGAVHVLCTPLRIGPSRLHGLHIARADFGSNACRLFKASRNGASAALTFLHVFCFAIDSVAFTCKIAWMICLPSFATPSDEYWLSIYVLLSRLRTFDTLLLLQAPSRDFRDGGPPAVLLAEYTHLEGVEAKTIRSLDATLAAYGATALRDFATRPLLQRLPGVPRQQGSGSMVPRRQARKRKAPHTA